MALVSVHGFRTLPGRFVEHAERTEEAKQLLQELGLAAVTLQPIAGDGVGGLATVVQYADNRAYSDALKLIQSDERWMEFYTRAMGTGAAEPTETSIYTDTDPTFVPDGDAMEVLQTTQWRTNPGRLAGFMENVAQAKAHIERLGGTTRIMQCMTGLHPMTVSFSVLFEDLDHFGEYGDKMAVDEQWQNYWAGVMADPTATLIRSGLYQIIA